MKHFEFTRVPTLPSIVDAASADIGEHTVRQCFASQSIDPDYSLRDGASLPLRDLIGLFERFARARGDAGFGFFVADALSPEAFGLFVQYAMQAPDLENAIIRTARGVRLHQACSTMTLRRNDAFAYWTYKIDIPLTIGRHHHAVHVLVQFRKFLTAFLGFAPDLTEVGLEAPQYGSSDEVETYFGAPIRWSSRTNYLSFPSSLLARSRKPLPAGPGQDPVTFSDLLRYARSDLPRTNIDMTTAAIRACVDGGTSIDSVAMFLSLGPRTLQRRLAKEGATFQEILENVRRERAQNLVTQTQLPIGEIAGMLGYSDPAHFTRAFRRWNDRTPLSFRREGSVAALRSPDSADQVLS